MRTRSAFTALAIGSFVLGCDALNVSQVDKLASISVHPPSATILAKSSMQFSATGTYESGKIRGLTPKWSLSGGNGIIDSNGIFFAGTVASTTSVLAQKDGLQGTATVHVIVPAPQPPQPQPPQPQPPGGGSCPTVYSWDGRAWRLDSGTFGGAIAHGLARTDIDNLEHAAAVRDVVTLRVRNELDETDHIDAISLLVIDHKPGITVAPTSDGRIFGLHRLAYPIQARDNRGRDILPLVARTDGASWESVLDIRNVSDSAAVTDPIELTFRRPLTKGHANLLITGQNTEWGNNMLLAFLNAHGSSLQAWYDHVDNDVAFARASRNALARTGFLHVSLWTRKGWQEQGIVWEVGPELMKQQVVPLDLRKAAPGNIRIRLEAPPSFWRIDNVALALKESKDFTVTFVLADDPVLRTIDDRMKTVTTGDGFQIAFKVPPQQPGRQRAYMLSSTGWYQFNVSPTGQPNREFMQTIAAGPRAMQRLSVELRNQLILRAQEGS